MALRFLADHCVSNRITNALREAGHDALRLRDHMAVESSGLAVINKARELGVILLSHNGDFADIVAYPPSQFRGIVALQIRDHPEVTPAVLRRLLLYTASHPFQQDYRGKLLLVEAVPHHNPIVIHSLKNYRSKDRSLGSFCALGLRPR